MQVMGTVTATSIKNSFSSARTIMLHDYIPQREISGPAFTELYKPNLFRCNS